MNLSAPFIDRPVATTLLTLGIALAGRDRVPPAAGVAAAAGRLPDDLGAGVAARREPGDDGGDGGDAARALARAHRRRHRDDVVELARARRASRCSSTSTATSTAPRATCRRRSTPRAACCRPACRAIPTYRKVNPADAPIMILALTSDTMTQGQMYDAASTIIAQKLSQVDGRRPGQRRRQLAAGRARRAEPAGAEQVRHRARGRARGDRGGQRQPAQGRRSRTATGTGRSTPTTRRRPPPTTCR